MARKGSGGGYIGLVLIFVIVGVVITLISNIFNFPIVITHGPKQYVSNIWQGHHDFYGKAKANYKVYDNILTVSELANKRPKTTIKRGYPFKFKGYVQKGSLTWIAVKVFKGSTAVNGFFVIEEKSGDSTFWNSVPFSNGDKINNKYFREITDVELEKVQNLYKDRFVQKVFEKINVKETSGNLNVQKIRESESYKIIPYISTDKKAYYCTNKEYEIVEDLDNRLLGDNFETNFLQTDRGYDPISSEISKESLSVKIASKWYFKIGFPIFLLLFLKSLLGAAFNVSPKCPECKSKDFSLVERLLIAEKYKQEKKNGERDRRYKNNPLISTYNLYFECNQCAHSWECEETEATNGDKTGNVKRKRVIKPKPTNKKIASQNQIAASSNITPPSIPGKSRESMTNMDPDVQYQNKPLGPETPVKAEENIASTSNKPTIDSTIENFEPPQI